MSAFVNPCGGKRWRELPSGLIEVEGEGTPSFPETSAEFKLMAQTWKNFGGELAAAGARHGVPAPWMLAVATMETGYLSADPKKQAAAVSPAGAIGVMQIMPANAKPFGGRTPEQLFSPSDNIDTGARILATHLKNPERGGLPGISALYNSGRLCQSGRNEWNLLADANYPRKVIQWNNSAVANGMTGGVSSTMLVALGAAFGAALALAFVGAVVVARR
jgi:hypothetical protein